MPHVGDAWGSVPEVWEMIEEELLNKCKDLRKKLDKEIEDKKRQNEEKDEGKL